MTEISNAWTPTDCLQRQNRGGWWEDVLSHRCVFPIGPNNTWSNIAYLVAGVAAALLHPSAWGFTIAELFGVLAIASGWYHGTKTLTAARADNAAIYALLSALLSQSVGVGIIPTLLGAGVMAGALAFGPWWRWTLEPVSAALVTATMVVLIYQGSVLIVVVSFLMFALAFAAWLSDRARSFPFPHWGHAVWHILTALALLLLFLAIP